ncbi:MAG TPA: 2-oxoglutarate dehydrogenase, E2 component, dihydrolipoamide succinyltransferase [Gemmatimonadaceae bacterium]|nr:2-oxoglutarate dehydrogenase, E2 component, dihydrolipoamide succinyltransferase [Gemmatimonadaceae bacterium]
MARIDVIMPQMGESIAEGTLSRWLKKVGDEVKRDEPIFEISTDKVDAEIPASSAGVLAEILVQEGETVPVQTVVARLETEKGAAIEAPAPAAAPAAAGAGSASAAPSTPAASSTAPTPAASARAEGGNGKSFESRVRTRSSPLVRKIAADHGIDISSMSGSGVAGRVTKRDIMEAIEAGTAPARGAPAAPMAAAASVAPPASAAEHRLPPPEAYPGDVVEPMSVMRQRIMEHMVLSRRTSAHVTSFMEIDFTRVARIRNEHRAEFLERSGQKLTYMPFIIKAVVDGLKAYPVMNSSVSGTNVIYRKEYNIGVAVALDWGLIVPVVKHADDLSLTGITRSLNDLAARARAKKLDPSEVQGGTFTITNPGVFGSLMGTPIISQPQVAILGVGAIEKRPKVITGADGEDTIAIRTCAYFSISFDHRIIDGAVADQFLAHVKKSIETFPDAGI